jgi:hypothetical protein
LSFYLISIYRLLSVNGKVYPEQSRGKAGRKSREGDFVSPI